MEAIRSWAVCVVVCILAAAVIQLLFPNLEKEKSVRIAICVFLITAVLSPFLSGRGMRVEAPELSSAGSQAEIERIADKINQAVAEQAQERLKKEAEEILADLGIQAREIQVNTDILKDGYIQIDEIVMVPQGDGDWQTAASRIEEKTGCPVRLQTR